MDLSSLAADGNPEMDATAVVGPRAIVSLDGAEITGGPLPTPLPPATILAP